MGWRGRKLKPRARQRSATRSATVTWTPGEGWLADMELSPDGDQFDDFGKHLLDCHPVRRGLVAEHDPMPKALRYDGADVVRRDVVAAGHPGVGPRAAVQRQRAARAGADLDPLR